MKPYIFVEQLTEGVQVIEHPFPTLEQAQNHATTNGYPLFDKNDWNTNWHNNGKYLKAYSVQNGEVEIDTVKVKELKVKELTTKILDEMITNEINKQIPDTLEIKVLEDFKPDITKIKL